MKFSKKLLSLLLCAVMVLGSVAVGGEGFAEAISNVFDAISVKASAEEVENSGTYGTNITWNLSDDGVLTISGTGNMPESYFSSDVPWLYSSIQIKTIVIVSGVTNIGALAFAGCDALTSITIPDSVTSIDEYAFSGCCNLTSITIPDSVKSIDEGAFEECTNLISVTLPNGLKTIESETFFNCINLTNVIIPDSVESIGASAFENCMGLKSVIIPNSVKSIGSCAFNHCIRIESITISDNVTDIEVRVFGDCENLKDVYVYCDSDVEDVKVLMEPYDIDNFTLLGHEFENNVCKVCGITEFDIEDGVLYEYNGNGGDVVIPDGVTSLMPAVFSYCTSMTSITIPEGVTSIRNHTFASCTNLSSVKIPNSVTSIGNHAFYNCTSLPSIVIPNSVTSIENNAFYFCTNLTSVTISDKVTSMGTLVFYMCNNLKDVYIPCDSDVEAVKDLMEPYDIVNFTQLGHEFENNVCKVCGITEFVIENGVLIGYNGKYGDIVIPDEVTKIEENLFADNQSITSVRMPNVTEVGSEAFRDCFNLTSAYMPKVEILESEAFSGCFDLSSVNMPNIRIIGDYVFKRCKFKSIDVSKAESIGNSAFYKCEYLTDITMNSGVGLGADVFFSSLNIKIVYYPCDSNVDVLKDKMNKYGSFTYTQLDHAFADGVCKLCGLEEFIIENGVLIGYNGKYGDIVIPDEVTKIEENLFADNQSITSVRMPNVTEVGSEAFRDCFNLTSAYMPKVEILESEAFSGCFDLSSVNMPNVRIIGDYVFKRCKFKSIDVSKAESIGNSAFYKCEYLTDITMNSGVGLGVDVFFSSSNIETVYCTCGSDADVLKEKMKSYGDLTYIQLEHNFVDFVCTACGAEDTAGKLAKAKADAKTAIEAAAGENYSVVVSQLVGLGLRDVQLAETLEKVNTVKENSINAIKTQLEKEAAAKALADAKTAAIAEINATKTEANATIAEKAITDINAATSVDDVNTIKTKALADMAKADADAAAAKALADAKTAAIAEINAAKTEDNKAVAEKAITDINAATKIDDVTTIKTKALTDMAKADEDAAYGKALTAAKDEALEAVDSAKEAAISDAAKNVSIYPIFNAVTLEEVAAAKAEALNAIAAAEKALADAKTAAITELETAKNNAVSDSAKAAIDTAIENVDKATNSDAVASAKAEGTSNAENADTALADAKTTAKAELETAKNNAVSDEAKAAIDTAIENVDKATNSDAVTSAKVEGTSNAENADNAYAEKIKFDNVNIKVAGAQTVDYRSIVTITATATNVPDDCKLVLYVNGTEVKTGDNKSVSYEYGEIKSDINYTVKVIDANGKVQKDSNENELSKDGGRITMKKTFFGMIIAFFKGLFNLLPKVEVKP